jgi:hypothetical protein
VMLMRLHGTPSSGSLRAKRINITHHAQPFFAPRLQRLLWRAGRCCRRQ